MIFLGRNYRINRSYQISGIQKKFDILCRKITSCAVRVDSIVKSTYNSRNKLQQNIKSYGGSVTCRKKDT